MSRGLSAEKQMWKIPQRDSEILLTERYKKIEKTYGPKILIKRAMVDKPVNAK